MKLGLYARVSTHEQQTLALQRDAMDGVRAAAAREHCPDGRGGRARG